MRTSENIGAISKALLTVQRELKPLAKSGVNPHFKSTYITLDQILEMAVPILNTAEIILLQGGGSSDDGSIEVVTRLLHVSGEWMETAIRLPLAKSDPQGAGSAVTYGKRYGLSAMLGISAETDDDGNAASGKKEGPLGTNGPKKERSEAAKSQGAPLNPGVLPGQPKAWGGNGGKPIGDVPVSALKAFVKWAEGDGERLAKFAAQVGTARRVIDLETEGGADDN